jgi:hypothetical protein
MLAALALVDLFLSSVVKVWLENQLADLLLLKVDHQSVELVDLYHYLVGLVRLVLVVQLLCAPLPPQEVRTLASSPWLLVMHLDPPAHWVYLLEALILDLQALFLLLLVPVVALTSKVVLCPYLLALVQLLDPSPSMVVSWRW